MNASFKEIGSLYVTFPAGTCQAGKVCKIGTTGKADSCTAGERFCGVVSSVRSNAAGVQLHGFVTVSYSGTTPKTGYCFLSADGLGGVRSESSGQAYLTVAVNTTAKTVTFEL